MRVRPSAGRTAVGGSVNDALVVRVVQATVDGKATAAVTAALADAFGVARSSVVLVSGSRSRLPITRAATRQPGQLECPKSPSLTLRVVMTVRIHRNWHLLG